MKENETESAVERFMKDFDMVLTKYHQNLLDESEKNQQGEGRIIYELTEADLQDQAEAYLDRPLTTDEMEKVSENIVHDIVAAICEALGSVDKV